MANDTKEILLDINVTYKDAIDGIVKLQKQLDELSVEQMKVNAAFKNGEKTRHDADKELEAIAAQTRLLKQAQREYRKEIDANLQAEEANTGSLKQMRAELKNLLKQYDELSQTDREEIGGVGEQKLVEIRRLQEELKNAEEASGRFQRSVGSYEDAIKRALDGTIPMKSAIRELKNDIQTLEFQYRNQATVIQQQEKSLAELANTVGVTDEEYKVQEQELERLKQEYAETGDALTKMKQAAGNMTDAIKDSNDAITNFGKDNANLKAMTQGAELLLNSYTALKAGMTALGIESEELYNIFSKIQILQQGLNAVNKIANMLEEQSLLRQQARLLWTKLTTTSIASLAAAKKKDAVASAQAAAADAALAAGETAATTAAGGLTVALKAVGKAIKSIPIIGWILAAVAAIGTLVGYIVKANKEEKKGLELKRQQKEYTDKLRIAQQKATESINESIVKLQADVRLLGQCQKGTAQWKKLVGEVSKELGVSEAWLQKNLDKIDELVAAWVNLAKSQAISQAYLSQLTDVTLKLNTLDISKLGQVMDASGDAEQWASALVREYGIAAELATSIADAYKVIKKNAGPAAANARRMMEGYIEMVKNSLNNQITDINTAIDNSFADLIDKQNDYSKIVGDGVTETGNKASKELTNMAKKLSEELEDLMVEGMADGLEKQIKEVQKASDRYVEKMKEARDKDKENAEYYDKIILEKERQTQDKIKKMRADGYKTILENAEKLAESYNKLWQSYAPNSFYNFVKDIEQITKDVTESVDKLNGDIFDLKNQINNYRNTVNYDNKFVENTEKEVDELKKQIDKNLEGNVEIPLKPKLVIDEKAVWQAVKKYEKDIGGAAKDLFNKEINNLISSAGTKAATDIVKYYEDNFEELAKSFGRDNVLLIYDALVDANIAMDGAVRDYNKKLAEYNDAVANNNKIAEDNAKAETDIAAKQEEIVKTKTSIVENEKTLAKLEADLAEKQKLYTSDFAKQILINRQANKALKEYAKTMQDVLMEQAKLGNISIIPDDFSIYIDYQIDKLEEELAKSYSKLEGYASNMNIFGNFDENDKLYDNEIQHFVKLQEELKAYREAKKLTFVDMNEKPEDQGFFNNDELIANQRNIQQVKNQIDVMTKSLEGGRKEQEAINKLEQDNEQLALERLGLLAQINSATDEDTKKQLQNQLALKEQRIAYNNELINGHKETMALIGYTTDEEMQQTLDSLKGQEKAFAKETDKIMKQTAVSVLQSISTMTNSLVDLFNEIGEDNAEMANFLEGVAYAQIGINMAVGIAEAIAAGAGVAFPANLAAIATGVAAVISGIASAISTYKQYHKDVTSPSFATGGLIGMRYARTREEGTRDDINIRASRGEYVVNAQAVKAYGVEFFDSINFGRKRPTHIGLNFADGGIVDVTTATKAVANEESYSMLSEALMNMPAPEVSVREITKVQNKVKAKESTARR